ncbi:MAG TPA: host attachment protein [Sedimenticola thiotaurini]|uniref:Host attachment protein n=1 Tax=Sedimenticola thiotaurini TaxID=1543721 RepID=A0A831RJR6_9GAMM|nr:host attachment protein [Sedimenticola thiotaurini]
MRKYLVVAADGSRARIFDLVPAEYPELESSPNLVEIEDLINPEMEEKGRDIWSEEKSGRGKAPGGGPAHGYDDHRGRHLDEIGQRFARSVAGEIAGRIRERGSDTLVLAAEHRFLGYLREALQSSLDDSVEVTDTDLNISKLSPIELHEHLARQQLIPERRPPQGR